MGCVSLWRWLLDAGVVCSLKTLSLRKAAVCRQAKQQRKGVFQEWAGWGGGGRSSVPFLAISSLERGSTSLACLLSLLPTLVPSGRGRAFPGEGRSRAWWAAPCSSLRRVLPVGSEGSAPGVWLQRLGTPHSRGGMAVCDAYLPMDLSSQILQ